MQKHFALIALAWLNIIQLQAQSCFCNLNDGYPDGWYKVLAPSGLTLRAGPGRQTAKLDAVPFGEEVLVCKRTGISETIEDKSGEWMEVTWADKKGYLFSGFLTQDFKPRVHMILPNSGVDSSWPCIDLPESSQWQALIVDSTRLNKRKEHSAHNYNAKTLKTGRRSSSEEGCGEPDLENAVLNQKEAPYILFSGFKLAQKVSNQAPAPEQLMPGNVYAYSTYDPEKKIAHHYTISVEGKAVPNPAFVQSGMGGPIDRIEGYKVILHKRKPEESRSPDNIGWNTQVLINTVLRNPGDTDTYQMDISYVYFAGDLDGDHELDLILANLNGVGHRFSLYLSSARLPGFILRYMAIWTDTAC
jgi:hypothetical protein